jgi:hypothetical protein
MKLVHNRAGSLKKKEKKEKERNGLQYEKLKLRITHPS